MTKFVTHTGSAIETQNLASGLAPIAQAGDLIVLCGDLGAGKTTFVQGFGGELGVSESITPPTFTIANRYKGDLTVNHLDVYRLSHIDEVVDLGLPELVDDHSVTLIEWGDSIAEVLGSDYLEVRIHLGEGPDDRVIEISAMGQEWRARENLLATLVGEE